MPQQTFSFMCLKLLEIQPYELATPERLICTVKNWEKKSQALTETVITFEYNAVWLKTV